MPIIHDVAAGPGWILSGKDLRPRITDVGLFREGMKDDPLALAIEALWLGDPARALRMLSREEQTLRVRALSADCLRDLGRADEALAEYNKLVKLAQGTRSEAFMVQHRGKVHLVLGNRNEAIEDFQRSVNLRTGGDEALLASALQALEFAQQSA